MTDLASATRIRIFISSPGDVHAERNALESVITNDLQPTIGRQHDLYLVPMRWETMVTPGMGDIQKKVFEEMGPYDIFVGVFWKRFGTPTSDHESGSEAEFRHAYSLWENDNSRPILMYFCEKPASIELDTDPDEAMKKLQQAQKVKTFREELCDKGLYWTYSEMDEFAGLVRKHLYDTIIRLVKAKSSRKAHDFRRLQPTIHSSYDPAIRRRYLEYLHRECQVLPLAQIGGKAGQTRTVSLGDVYIGLSTTTPVHSEVPSEEREKTRYLTAREAAMQSEYMVLLGDPGSGKSTFAKQLVAEIAQERMSSDEGILPSFIILRDLAPRLGQADLTGLSLAKRRRLLAELVLEQAVSDLVVLKIPEAEELLSSAFSQGDILLVLDGLDEVPYDLRGVVREAVGAVIHCYAPQRVMVTCRIRSYTEEARLNGFETHTLAPFRDEEIKGFIAGWYNAQIDIKAVSSADAVRLTKELQQAAMTGYLRQLAENPMLMTTMVMVHQEETELPRERVVLYDKAVDILLRKWQQTKGSLPEDLEDLFKSQERIRPVIERLAYQAHHKGADDDAADLPRLEALSILESPEYLGSLGFAERFINYVDERSGLLVGRGGAPGKPAAYSFPHRTFQEYLAGCYLVNRRSAVRDIRMLAKEGDFWSVAVQLGAQELLFNRRNINQLLDNAESLLPVEVVDEPSARECLWSAQMANVVGRDAVVRDEATGEPFLDRVGSALVRSIGDFLPPVERAEAGRLLNDLGDPREELLTMGKMHFSYVPAGPFLMGGAKEVMVPYGYYIGKYPVTQAQFNVFVEAGGYEDKRWWTEAGWKYILGEDRKKPVSKGDPFDRANHPVVGVSWYEAYAFTQWLTNYARKKKWIGKGDRILLPNEPEWEKAARGGSEVPQEVAETVLESLSVKPSYDMLANENADREYPWGDKITSNHCNYEKSGIGTTSTPGCFPMGVSPYGVHDLSGNVWEWNRSLYDKAGYTKSGAEEWGNYEDPEEDVLRVLRGGSFDSNFDYVRCASRSGYYPNYPLYYWGFRLVALPRSD